MYSFCPLREGFFRQALLAGLVVQQLATLRLTRRQITERKKHIAAGKPGWDAPVYDNLS